MTRVLGMLMGLGILGLAFVMLGDSLEGWNNGYADIGFWWGIIALFLAIAGVSAIVGTYIHTNSNQPVPILGGLKESLILFYRGVEKPAMTDEK
jgi:hypothetical protein|tara:strand:- start:657 stop:938 length:282 start_codon:yes stop_codon:yes gene_type:complete